MTAPHTFTVAHEGIHMRVLAMGQGEPVVFVHGFGGSSDSWFFNTRPLAQRFRVYAVDLPGFGRSTKTVRGAILPFFAEWLERLLDLNRHAAAHVVGNSMGGAVSLHLALERPERVNRLVLVDPAGLGLGGNSEFRRALIAARTADEVRAAFAQVLYDPALLMPEMVERLHQYKQQPGAQAVVEQVGAQLAAGGAVDFRPRLPSVRARTLVVWGREDRLIPVAHAENARAIPGARIHIFDRCGHIPQVEAAEAFNMLLFEFLTTP